VEDKEINQRKVRDVPSLGSLAIQPFLGEFLELGEMRVHCEERIIEDVFIHCQ
jgi:hypothetical protein